MTIEEFDKKEWNAGLKAEYNTIVFEIGAVDFKEKLIALIPFTGTKRKNWHWVRCENCEIKEL
jgi:hypothetical protein